VQIVAGPRFAVRCGSECDESDEFAADSTTRYYSMGCMPNGIHKAADANTTSSAITVADTLFTPLARVG
jgi:hypothetical protein